jgi:hypothetical protein
MKLKVNGIAIPNPSAGLRIEVAVEGHGLGGGPALLEEMAPVLITIRGGVLQVLPVDGRAALTIRAERGAKLILGNTPPSVYIVDGDQARVSPTSPSVCPVCKRLYTLGEKAK